VKGILFTFSVDIVVKKCLITDEQPEMASALPFLAFNINPYFSLCYIYIDKQNAE
jgi:hypothetical protein